MHPTKPAAPLARADGLSIRELDGEILVYDRASDEAHCLTSVAARVWRACDGERDVATMSRELGVAEATVADALAQLEAKNLVSVNAARGDGLSRGQFIGRTAAVLGAPLVLSALAPSAQAGTTASACPTIGCSVDVDCTSRGCGTCDQTSGFCRAP